MFGKSKDWRNGRSWFDEHLQDGNKKDTEEYRLVYFRQALAKLKDYLLEFNNDDDDKDKKDSNNNNNKLKINTIVFPYKIGCGLAGGEWEDYKREIERFAKELLLLTKTRRKKIDIFIVRKEGY